VTLGWNPAYAAAHSNLSATSLKPINKFKRGNQLDGKHRGEFKGHQAHLDQQLSSHATANDRYANFSASTRPTQARSAYSKLYSGQAATRKISSAA
jgi:hypothetical protein